eukprot:5863855-Prymnesium_polylepis.1
MVGPYGRAYPRDVGCELKWDDAPAGTPEKSDIVSVCACGFLREFRTYLNREQRDIDIRKAMISFLLFRYKALGGTNFSKVVDYIENYK